MSTTSTPTVRRAQLRRVCCDYDGSRVLGRPSGACWELYLVVYNTTEQWPHHKWPVARRHQVPTLAERTRALASLGYSPAADAEWQWQETDTPSYHGHKPGPTFLGSIDIVPLGQAQSHIAGGEL